MTASQTEQEDVATADAMVAGTPAEVELARPRGNVRWSICALLFFATTINYMDRQVIGKVTLVP